VTDQTLPITIRTATDETLRTILAPLPLAFGEMWSDDEIENERHLIDVDRVIGAFEGETPVGASAAFPFRMTTPGGDVGTAGITLVGVLPTHRRKGILRLMMADLFETARVRREAVAILWASEAAIYQHFGYGLATFQTSFDTVKDKIRFRSPIGPLGRVRIVEREEAVKLCSAVYDARQASMPGAIARSDAKWRYQMVHDAAWMQADNGAKIRAVLEVDGEPRAYVIYRHKPDWDETGPKAVLTVLELIGVDAAAEQALWEWLFSIDLVAKVRAWRGPMPHPLQLMITEPRRLNALVSDGMWLRIIDLPEAMASRRFRGPASLVLEVTDAFCPWNAGRWQLTVPGPDGSGKLTPAPDSAPSDLALDISDLATLYLGTVRLGDLARAGRVRECRAGALNAADALFATSVSPSNSTMF
jgi:predicted acetyltransferase